MVVCAFWTEALSFTIDIYGLLKAEGDYICMEHKIEINLSEKVPEILLPTIQGPVESLTAALQDQAHVVDNETLSQFYRVLAASCFVAKQVSAYPDMAVEGLSVGIETLVYDNKAYLAKLATVQLAELDEAGLMKYLRQFRNQQMMIIAWRDQLGETVNAILSILSSLSDLADALLIVACDWAYTTMCNRYGLPRDTERTEQKLIIIGMGKLGARELNFSSDIDLIFCYPSAGETDGKRAITNEEFFTRMCRLIVKLLDQQTADGFVFRVDTRLRPFGDSGALVLNSDAMEIYYQSHAREWERYAMVKARLITGEEQDKKNMSSMIKAFVFRRYLDYGVFDSIRVMKRQIEAQLQRKGVENNVKLGPGGIREIEFIGQAFQLIRGGRDKSLQARGILNILSLLAEKGHILTDAAEQLAEDYTYLRRLENRIQEIDDKQTHQLPTNELDQQRLMLAMGVTRWDDLVDKVHQVMARVHSHFDSLVDFSKVFETTDNIEWLEIDDAGLSNYFKARNITASETVRQDIVEFCQSYPVRRLQEKGRQYLNRLMPMLVDSLLLESSHEAALSLFLKMLEKICNRIVYLILLVENQAVFDQLLRLAKLSPWVITQVTKAPILLDELIDPASLYHPPEKKELLLELDKALAEKESSDLEGQMDALRLFKQVNVLRVAAADLTGVIPLMVVSDKLTAIAEVIVEKVLLLCWQAVAAQYGMPAGANCDEVSGFSVIGFGKLGGLELGFSSDLDVIFLHKDAEIDELTCGNNPVSLGEFYMRLGRKIITFMTTRTFSGLLYEMDLRLRPNGKSGLLVTSETSFATYQKERAWTWEHQALIRARFIAGCKTIGAVFDSIRADVLAKPVDVDKLRNDVVAMREKMRLARLKKNDGVFDLKHGLGGIVDIEFIVQFGVLANASQNKTLLVYTDNIRLLLELNKVGFLTYLQQQGLSFAYKAYREAAHHAALAENPAVIDANLVAQHTVLVSSIWQTLILNR